MMTLFASFYSNLELVPLAMVAIAIAVLVLSLMPKSRAFRATEEELRRANRDLEESRASSQLLKKFAVAANEAAIPKTAMVNCLTLVCAYTGWSVGHAYLVPEDERDQLV